MGIEDIISTDIVVLNDEERRLVENSFKRLSGGNEAYVFGKNIKRYFAVSLHSRNKRSCRRKKIASYAYRQFV